MHPTAGVLYMTAIVYNLTTDLYPTRIINESQYVHIVVTITYMDMFLEVYIHFVFYIELLFIFLLVAPQNCQGIKAIWLMAYQHKTYFGKARKICLLKRIKIDSP